MRRATAVSLAAAAGVLAQAGPAVVALDRLRPRRLAGDGEPGHVALTFDDGPDPASTPRVLEALESLGWRATFFMVGRQVRAHPALAAEVVARGHEVALHGDSHTPLLVQPPWRTAGELHRGYDSLRRLTGVPPRWYRPTYGELTGVAWMVARRLGLTVVLWGAAGRDWGPAVSADSVVGNVARRLRPGVTVLLHDASRDGAWRASVAALPGLARLFERSGLRAGPLGEHGCR